MTVEELIKLLQKEDPRAHANLCFKCYPPVQGKALRDACYAIDHILAPTNTNNVFLIASQ